MSTSPVVEKHTSSKGQFVSDQLLGELTLELEKPLPEEGGCLKTVVELIRMKHKGYNSKQVQEATRVLKEAHIAAKHQQESTRLMARARELANNFILQ